MKIIHMRGVNKNIFDVFFGNGWKTWARFRLTRDSIIQIKGIPVSPEVTCLIVKELR